MQRALSDRYLQFNNLNIYAYLETVLLYMPDYKNEPEGIEELMPVYFR